MIVVKLIGGLGNQMFQYAAGKALAMHHNTELYLDVSGLLGSPNDACTPRKFELGAFHIRAEIAGQAQLSQFDAEESVWVRKYKSMFPFWFKQVRLNESQSGFYSRFFKLPANTYLNGYWQTENYFLQNRQGLLADFTLKKTSEGYNQILEQINSCNSVSLHVRRGDYVTLAVANEFHGVLPLRYYKDAMSYLNTIQKQLVYFVFSDDIPWCRKNLNFLTEVRYVDGGQSGLLPQEELVLMSRCKHHIIANSSFSWWGAWLNRQHDTTVIAPVKWFNKLQQPKDLIPKRWIRL